MNATHKINADDFARHERALDLIVEARAARTIAPGLKMEAKARLDAILTPPTGRDENLRSSGGVRPQCFNPLNSPAMPQKREPKCRQWTPDEVRRLQEMYLDGMHINEISERLGRRVNSTCSKVRQLGINNRVPVGGSNSGKALWTEAEDAILRQGYAEGKLLSWIGAQVGRSPKAVQNRAGKLKLFMRRHQQ